MRNLTDITPLNELTFSILRKYPETRLDDTKLIYKVLELRMSKSGRNLHWKEFLKRMGAGKIDNTESIRRYSRTYRKKFIN